MGGSVLAVVGRLTVDVDDGCGHGFEVWFDDIGSFAGP
jgi:hypothetical protein